MQYFFYVKCNFIYKWNSYNITLINSVNTKNTCYQIHFAEIYVLLYYYVSLSTYFLQNMSSTLSVFVARFNMQLEYNINQNKL